MADPPPDHGPTPHRPVRHIGVNCRAGTMGLGPNLALELVDVSEDRLELRLASELPVGAEVEMELSPPGLGKPYKLRGDVSGCRAAGNGTFLVRVWLRHRLTYRQLSELSR